MGSKATTVMRYLLVAADKSSKLPIVIPDEIVVKNNTQKSPKFRTTKKRVQKKDPKSNNSPVKKRKQTATALAK